MKLEQKSIKGKPFYYLSSRATFFGENKKIQVYVGKTVPSDLEAYERKLEKKEVQFIRQSLTGAFLYNKVFSKKEVEKLEEQRIKWKYYLPGLTRFQQKQLWTKFAIQFAFDSNAIEGSKLSQTEVEKIVKNRYVKKSLKKTEVQEVYNAVEAFNTIRSKEFKLNQRSIVNLHKVIVNELGIPTGYKKHEIVVNNKPTAAPGQVRSKMAHLLDWWKTEKKSKKHPLQVIADFHQKFESIHPFEDGNGRTGRLIFIWMLIEAKYPPILFSSSKKQAYMTALSKADEGGKTKWYWYVLNTYASSVKWLVSK